MSRVVCWFSAGAASAVATKLALAESSDVVVAYCDPGNEHPDNQRFIADCERWFGAPVIQLHSKKYRDCWQVWEERRFLVGPDGALCTAEMKKKLRYDFERPDDRQVFGFTAEERGRAGRFREQNPGVDLVTPLIDHELAKSDCLALVERAGITLPAMYLLGYANANCVGCVHGGMSYWNAIRVDFPLTFLRMAAQERAIDHALLKDDDGPVFLDELDPARGDGLKALSRDCSLLCMPAEAIIEGAAP